ncbi:MAG TPA: hypothetical protein VKR82_13000 [Candidatus Acidoferrales bacterium]|nr:hypothetical protein [Candidatus Acidoferrales bacterium]
MFRTGRAPIERKLAVCTGAAPLALEDRAELLAILSADPDKRIAERSANSLLSLPLTAFTAALARSDAAPQLFEYCGNNLIDKPEIAGALVRHQGAPLPVLATVALRLPEEEARALANDLDLMSTRPELAEILRSSPAIAPDQRQMLDEMGQGAPDSAALAEVLKEIEGDQEKKQSLLQRLSRMRVVERMQLAIKGGREERMALIRDSCKVVQRAVMQSPKLSEREVEGFAGISSLSEDVLRIIANARNYRKNYAIVRALAFNPKTPLDVSLRLLPMIHVPELRSLMSNKNVPETLRTTATKLFRQRTDKKD